MLIDDMLGAETAVVYPNGVRHDSCWRGIKERLAQARPYILDAGAVGMACGVALSKPSSLIAAMPFMRLPAEYTWMECVPLDARQAMAELGSPNIKGTPGSYQSHIERAGLLMRERSEEGFRVIDLEYVHRDRVKDMSHTDVSPVRGVFRIPEEILDMDAMATALLLRRSADVPKTQGRLRRSLDLITTDPREAAADAALKSSLHIEDHEDIATSGVLEGLSMVGGMAGLEEYKTLQGIELSRWFFTVVLPALILLSSRNAVKVEAVPAPEKLNRKRTKSGKRPIVAHNIVTMSLSHGISRRGQDGSGAGRRSSVAHAVAGHMKVRKTGVFYWRPHVRGSGADIRQSRVKLTR